MWKVEQKHEITDIWNSKAQPALKKERLGELTDFISPFPFFKKWNAFSSSWCDLELFIVTDLNSYIVLTLLLI